MRGDAGDETGQQLGCQTREGTDLRHRPRRALRTLARSLRYDQDKAAEQTVEAENARALDIENPDPDEADATARKARLTIGRRELVRSM